MKPDYNDASTLDMNHPKCTKTFGCEIPDCNCMCHYKGRDLDFYTPKKEKKKINFKKVFKEFFQKKEQKEYNLKCNFANCIREFYTEKAHYGLSSEKYNESLKPIIETVETLGITALEVKGHIYTITMRRPGIFIGRRGKNIEEFTTYLKEKLDKRAILKIKEDKIIWRTVPLLYEDWEDVFEY